MLKQNILNKITILYVEDEFHIRDSMVEVFEKLFKETYVAKNGKDGLDLFEQLHSKNITVDIIISDINMPGLNGLNMLKQIQKINNTIPIILTTAHAQTEYFLDAIELGVMHYAIKPINVKDLITQIEDISIKKIQQLIIKNQEKETKQYLDIINKVAIVSKTDLSGNITFANDIFCEVSGYTKEELIGSPQRIVRHPEVSTKVFIELWNTLKAGQVWHGKIKNKAKNGEAYVVNATIFPIFDETGETIKEYMAVRFVITEEENEKREFHKKVITNIKEHKQFEQDLLEKVKELESELKFSDHDSFLMMQNLLELEKEKTIKAKKQVSHYEKELQDLKNKSLYPQNYA